MSPRPPRLCRPSPFQSRTCSSPSHCARSIDARRRAPTTTTTASPRRPASPRCRCEGWPLTSEGPWGCTRPLALFEACDGWAVAMLAPLPCASPCLAPLSPRRGVQEEALRTFTALALSDELRLEFRLEPGDLGLVNNLTMLHAKTAFRVRSRGEGGRRRPHCTACWPHCTTRQPAAPFRHVPNAQHSLAERATGCRPGCCWGQSLRRRRGLCLRTYWPSRAAPSWGATLPG